MRTLGGRYQLEQRIGIGGMSEVWRGHDQVLDRPVAVKLMAPWLAGRTDDDVSYDRVRAEARSAARLSHPNVASVHDFGMSSFVPGQQAPYIVMELVEGQTLAVHLASGPLDWRIGVRICAEVSAALAAAHAHRIVHRDVKPANIMLTPAGVKVLDFGIAAAAGQRDPDYDGAVVGTPAYVAPERFDGVPATPASDIYALGVLLYHCLTGRLPWPADTGTQLLYSHRHVEPEPLPALDGVPAEVIELCAQCLGKDPTQRPTSMIAALVLAEAVDARVYVPLADVPAVPTPGPGTIPAWDERAANAATGVAAPPGDRVAVPPENRVAVPPEDPAEVRPEERAAVWPEERAGDLPADRVAVPLDSRRVADGETPPGRRRVGRHRA
ncbi:MAG TPA: serine/threonine-protein kinase [Catenuloplanes sp.]|jgi:serine/threonine-protein kinase